MMKLEELEPRFLKITTNESWQTEGISLEESDGIIFLCPKCFQANSGPVGTHSVICFKPHVPQTVTPGPGRWSMKGTGIHDLTLVAGSSSVSLTGGCAAHFFITNGEIVNC